MRSKIVVFFVCLLFVSIRSINAQQPVFAVPGLFTDAPKPTIVTTAYPENTGFLTINASVFTTATAHNPEIFTITNFPLGAERVILHVEQFDVLNKDSRLVLGTKKGDVPTAIPPHILLRGSVEGKENSHVYIAVFDGYAIGYIDITGDRYLIQPVKMNTESPSVMIVYKENDIARQIPLAEKWNCGTEEYAPNFSMIAKISAEIQKPSHLPQIQAQSKKVHLLSIAIDCDYEYFLVHGSDQTRAQNYTIAVLGAQSDIYTRDLNCGVRAGYLRVWTIDDPYPGDNTSDMLDQFITYWNGNMANVTRAAALLYSSHGGGGLAFVGTLCSEGDGSLGYGVCGLNTGFTFPSNGYIWDVDVSSHEFGHICGSLHTHNCSWKPPVDSCVGSEGGCYATPLPRKGTIMSYCHLTSFGTELKFHSRVATFLKSNFNKSTCAAYVDLPIAVAGPDKIICSGGSTILGGDFPGGLPPFTYSWRPATGLSSTQSEVVTANPSKTTTYITSVTDANDLRTYDTVNVIVQKPVVSAGGNVTVCGVGKYLLSGSATGYPPFTYQWIDTALNKVIGTTAQVELPLAKTRTYKLVVTDSVGCTASDIMTITLAQKPAANIIPSGDTAICAGSALTLDAGVDAGSYLWSNGKKTRKITVASSGSFYCLVSNGGSGCADTSKTVKVTVYPLPQTPVINQVGDSIFSSNGVSYQWYEGTSPISGAISQKYVPTASGDYSVQISNENGCSAKSQGFPFTYNSHSGVDNVDVNNLVRIYPNPAKDIITFDYSAKGSSKLDLYITDMLGKTVYKYSSSSADGSSEVRIDTHSFAQGAYFIHYSFGEGFTAMKFVKE